jgi:probable F420-dependent oxidoreductase
LKFGLLLPVEGSVTSGRPDLNLVERVSVKAEEVGFTSLWAGDRVLFTPRFEATTLLSYLAAKTAKVRLGTAVILLPLRNPVLLAHSMASLDIISHGRLVVGAGIGAQRVAKEYEVANVPFQDRAKIFEETIKLIKSLWSSNSVNFDGSHFRIKDLSLPIKPIQKPGPPLLLAGVSSKSLRRVALLGDGWIPTEIKPNDYSEYWHRIAELALKFNRNPSDLKRAFYFTTNFDEDEDRARREGKLFLDTYYSIDVGSIDKFGLFGTESRLVDRLQEYSNAGVDEIIVRFASFDMEKRFESFIRDILPSFS